MRLIQAVIAYPTIRIFRVADSDSDDQNEWDVEPADASTLSGEDGFFIVKAKHILPDGTLKDCYIDVSLPERISDFAYFLRGDTLHAGYFHEFEGEIICGVPIESFGVYELFYSRIIPDTGIEILKQGIGAARRKQAIAEDLGYILRDERRFKEATEMFQIAVDEGPSSYFIYGELAGCYDKIGNKEMAEKSRRMFDNPSSGAAS